MFGYTGAKLEEGGDISAKSKIKRCPPLNGGCCSYELYELQRPNFNNEVLNRVPNMHETL